MATQDHSEEIERLVRRTEKDPRTHTFARLADLYRKSGELDLALEVIEGGLEHHPHYLNARLVHAKVLRELGRPVEARHAFERVLQIDTENLVARAALDDLGSAVTVAPDRPDPSAGGGGPGAIRWLARLDAEWRGGEGRGDDDKPRDPDRNEPRDRARPPTDVHGVSPPVTEAPDSSDEPEDSHELETATLASLYLRQGLFDRAIQVYQRLLARDPYNARLAGALDDARAKAGANDRRGPRPKRESKPAQDPPAPAPEPTADPAPPSPGHDARRAESDPVGTGQESVRTDSIQVELGRILDGVAEEEAYGLVGGWAEWLARREQERG